VLRLLLDTSYILPTLGVEVPEVEAALERLLRLRRRGLVEIYYSSVSLLEALAKAAKLGVPPDAVEQGLIAIAAGYRAAEAGPEAWLLAYELRRLGLRDMVDAILYATAYTSRLRLLTRDRALRRFLGEKGYPLTPLIGEDELPPA